MRGSMHLCLEAWRLSLVAGVRLACLAEQVQSHDLRPAGPGDVIVHGGEVHLVSSDR